LAYSRSQKNHTCGEWVLDFIGTLIAWTLNLRTSSDYHHLAKKMAAAKKSLSPNSFFSDEVGLEIFSSNIL